MSEESAKRFASESDMLIHGGLLSRDEGFYEGVLSAMRDDQITAVAKRDELIVCYGTSLFSSRETSKKWYISQKIRLLARLLKELRKDKNVYVSFSI